MKKKRSQSVNRFPALRLALFFVLGFGALCLLPRVHQNPKLLASVGGTAIALLIFRFLLGRAAARSGRRPIYEFVPVKAHYVQLVMHSCIYTYWGLYWPQVYTEVPLILAQVVFAYALDMMVCWSRRDKWIFGFGPIPIIFSANLFLWFRDDWYWLQFLLVATGVLCKEFIKWERDGRRTHIFNPSAIALSVFSVALLLTGSTGITWGPEIARSLHLPPFIYPEIFILGLVVQGLFSVTLVTLSAASVLFFLNLAFTRYTGVYYFVDSNIPVSVFIGLHLLVTDPSTSPRRPAGKLVFGGLYGFAVFALYGILGSLQAPQFYDKLLCVPLLNLSVRAIDRWSGILAARFHPLNLSARWGARKLNFAQMGIWAALFSVMFLTGFLGNQHPGQKIAFWKDACANGKYNSCRVWAHALETDCANSVAASCLDLGNVLDAGRVAPRNRLEAGRALGKACDLGLREGCLSLDRFSGDGGAELLTSACGKGDVPACYIMAGVYSTGHSVPVNTVLALAMYQKACDAGMARACERLGQVYLSGRKTLESDRPKAALNFDKACDARDGAACYTAAMLYLQGTGVPRDEARGEERMRKACALGNKTACQLLDPSLAGMVPIAAPGPR